MVLCFSRNLAAATVIAILIPAMSGLVSAQQKSAAAGGAVAEGATVRYEIDIAVTPYAGQIRKLTREGMIEFEPVDGEPVRPDAAAPVLTEGYFLGIVQEAPGPSIVGARVLRVLVTEVLDDGRAVARLAGDATKKVKSGEIVLLVRPVRATTAQMKILPDFAVLEAAEAEAGESLAKASLAQSWNNLRQIGLALHNYHDTFGTFPPAVINGPDGEPWHSWRVLILPFLDNAPLYNQYRFDEPWDGPHNSQLLDRMPAVYSDPIHGENPDHLTHYIAFCGDGYAFSGDGVEMNGRHLSSGRRIAQFTDGTSNTLLVGPAVPEEQIPWMKPEDITFTDEISVPGSDDSIALPYEIDNRRVAPILRCDGSVFGLTDEVDRVAFKAMLTIGGGESVNWDSLKLVAATPLQKMTPVILVETTAQGVRARITEEPLRARGSSRSTRPQLPR